MRVGWIGTGVMGGPMAGHLLAAGHEVAVFNRTRSRADTVVAAGGEWCDSPAAVAARSEVLFTMVGYPDDVRETVGMALPELAPGSLLIDMTTSEPTLAVTLAESGAAVGVDVLDAPVSGGDVGARNATLVIMAGGPEAAFARARPLFEVLGSKIAHCGGPGTGQHTKMANQITIASGMVGVSEALLYAYRAGLDLEATIDTISGGAAGSWSLSNLAPRVARGDLEPGFKIDHFVKDLGIALAEARRMTLPLPGLALAEALYQGARAQDLGQKGTQALLPVLARLAAIDWTINEGET